MIATAFALISLIALDRASKILFEALLANGRTVTLIPGVIELRLLEGGNSGAAFGILKNSTGLLIVLTFALVFGLLWLLFFKKFASRWLTAAAILVTAGGIGNLYDRVAYGYVTDFFHFLFVEFPVFNVADCCVTIGAVIVCAYLLLSKQEAPLFENSKDNGPPPPHCE